MQNDRIVRVRQKNERPQALAALLRLLALIAVIASLGWQNAWARDVRVTFPKRSELTPVQRLNRQGVDAVRKHQYEKAEAIFYKAYLYDAADPFTLNNLGYVSELEGKLDRAKEFYALASQQDCDARIDLSNAKQLEGKPMTYALNSLQDVSMRVDSMNVQAVELLSRERNFEAELLLRKALALQPQNPFTLNNLGVAEEATGNDEEALQHYDAAASLRSLEPIIVTLDRSWRGKPVSRMAAESARRLRGRMQDIDNAEARARMFTLRGVSAANRNDWTAARQDFLQAYSLAPDSAFSLNNLGYVAERDGDLETAQFYYSKARKADDASARIGLATQRSYEGKHLVAVAMQNGQKVDGEIDRYSQAARKQTGPIQLLRRDNTPAGPNVSPNKPWAPVSPDSGPQTPK
ncbi:MAG: tetratricopeptide repeat protein [Acidobacteriaceae bacterium]